MKHLVIAECSPDNRQELECLLRSHGFDLRFDDRSESKQAETSLQESEDKFRKIFRSSPDLIMLTRLDGTILDANAGFTRVTEHPVEHAVGKTTLELDIWVNVSDRECFVRTLRDKGRVLDFEVPFRTRSGHLRHSLVSAEMLELNGETIIISIARDVTEQRRIEEEKQRYQQLLESIRNAQRRFLEELPPITVFTGMLDDLLKVTQSEYGFIGRVLQGPDGKPYLKTHAITNIAWDAETRELYQQNSVKGFEFFNLNTLFGEVLRSGEPVISNDPSHDPRRGGLPHGHPELRAFLGLPFRYGDELMGMVGIANRPGGYSRELIEFLQPFVTTCGHLMKAFQGRNQRRQMEAELCDSKTMLQLVLDSIPQGVFWKDRNSVYLGANRVSREAMGLAETETPAGLSDFDLKSLTPDEAVFFIQKDREVMESDQPQLGIVESMTLADGRTIWLETNKMPLHDASGKVTGLLGTWQDITEKKKNEEALRASKERLVVLSRQLLHAQESERRILSRELHDEIGQSLTGIKLNLKALQQPEQAARAKSLINDTLTVVDRTLKLVRNLALDLRPSMLDELGLVAALRWCLDRQAQRADYTAEFLSDVSDISISPEIAITCFRVVQECLTNIARHAKATCVWVELHSAVDELKLIVRDNGCGFDFPAAYHRATLGASLGLLGMQERVDLVDGRIDIVSDSNGTTIHVSFPLNNRTPRQQADQ